MWKNRLAFALLYAALLVLLIAFSKPFLPAALIVLAVSAALMALLTRRDARLLRTSVRVKSGGREGETVPMTFTFAPKRQLLALAPVPAVLIVTGFRRYIAGGRAWLNAMLDRWNTVHEGGLALFSGTAGCMGVCAAGGGAHRTADVVCGQPAEQPACGIHQRILAAAFAVRRGILSAGACAADTRVPAVECGT